MNDKPTEQMVTFKRFNAVVSEVETQRNMAHVRCAELAAQLADVQDQAQALAAERDELAKKLAEIEAAKPIAAVPAKRAA